MASFSSCSLLFDFSASLKRCSNSADFTCIDLNSERTSSSSLALVSRPSAACFSFSSRVAKSDTVSSSFCLVCSSCLSITFFSASTAPILALASATASLLVISAFVALSKAESAVVRAARASSSASSLACTAAAIRELAIAKEFWAFRLYSVIACSCFVSFSFQSIVAFSKLS